MLLEDLLDEYLYHNLARGFTEKTIANKRHEFKHFKAFIHEKRAIKEIENITSHDLKAYIRYKQQAGLQSQSIVSLLKMIKAFFNWSVKESYLTENPMNKVDMPKVPKKMITGFTENEVARMINAFTYNNYFESRNKAVIAMLADTGIRSAELRGLKNNDLNETTILINGKGRKQRNVFISPHLKKILIRYERMKKDYFLDKLVETDHYFLTYLGGGLSHIALYDIIKLAGKRCGIEGKRVSPHTLRHFYSVQALNSGNIDIFSLSKMLGHSDISTTQRYLNSMTDAQLQNKAMLSSPLSNLNKK
ncbi:recombinase [Alkalihalophilus pseudofirmus]|nr:recombinase [Alkalihalophilus pseudofirmus]